MNTRAKILAWHRVCTLYIRLIFIYREDKKMKKIMLMLSMVLVLVIAGSASADTYSFELDIGNTAISGYTEPYASVEVNRTDSTHATITFNSLTNSGNLYLLGDGGSVAVNVNATSWTIGNFTGSNSGTGFTPGPYSDGGAGNEDGFGSFNQTVNSFDGFTHSSDSIEFVLTNTSGTWADAPSVLMFNSENHLAAAHIFVTSNPADAANGAIVTGFASGSTPPPIPEPATMLLLGSGLIGLAGYGRKKLFRR
jgi:hypothetical protein